jgi:hypothetical protein
VDTVFLEVRKIDFLKECVSYGPVEIRGFDEPTESKPTDLGLQNKFCKITKEEVDGLETVLNYFWTS